MGSSMLEIAQTEQPKETRSLYLSKRNIISTDGIEAFVNLKRLDLSNNSISELNGIDKLVNLEILDLSNNKIDIVGFYHNSQLSTSIFIGKNRIVLPTSLIELNLDFNSLSTTSEEWLDNVLEAPRNLPNLELKKLTLKGNSFDTLESLSGIETIKGLEYLDLRDNCISNFGALLACIPWESSDKLTVRLEGNKFDESQVENLTQILSNFPQLNLHLDCLENFVANLDRVKFTPSIVTRAGGLLVEGITRVESLNIKGVSSGDANLQRISNVFKPKMQLDTLETADTMCDANVEVEDQKKFVDQSNHLMKKLDNWICHSNGYLANVAPD